MDSVDIFTEYYDDALIYSCKVGQKTKLAKFAGMKLWLQKKQKPQLVRMLEGLHWLLQNSQKVENAKILERDAEMEKFKPREVRSGKCLVCKNQQPLQQGTLTSASRKIEV
ncbi:hypothetical protein OS493_035336 [Desmophyllum pertusum]|uniref:Uncharacterized protein n=1 Tax=Desmophyllum pertusum TaxID=174260 RepID=A0A9W9Y7W1_9CNID|nr:hypothetical protein OS493_035336 [Desmophyllum pertusum]